MKKPVNLYRIRRNLAVVVTASLLLLLSGFAQAEQDKSWLTDKPGREQARQDKSWFVDKQGREQARQDKSWFVDKQGREQARQDKSWFVDKQGRKHPGFSFRFGDKKKLGRAIRAQKNQINKMFRKRGIVGSAIGWDKEGNPIIRVFGDGAVAADLPAEIDGFPVQLEATGAVYALKYVCRENNPNRSKQCPESQQAIPASSIPTSTTDRQRPIYNGASIGHFSITAGTVGCIVSQSCHTLVLSNNHVLANSNIAAVGDPILQPGPIDGGNNPNDVVGTVYDWVDIVMSTSASNRVDAAVALITGQDFTNETLPDGYGRPRAEWRAPQAGMNVQKYGRTTDQTQGIITGINAIVHVNYSTCCAQFVDQVVIEPSGGFADFALGGDSGSLVVINGGPDDRKPVALVFALAENGEVFANPISEVLSQLNIEILGD
jgi:hypothetical protein